MTTGWVLYLLVSGDGKRTYVGVTTDMERRLEQHNGERPGGAKSTRAGRPWKLLRSQAGFPNRSEAQIEESLLKQLNGDKRVAFFARY
ncbi:MAG: GIY-YIG nuclease family protein [Planctomycetes bacterium]|nr:GIY-YIG nuclease family protein [Planctomycetota bacterium]MCP4771651.1 GIY-YIG nuclease family protein [Planctomycetota bacterium]MCP4860049.1 GIY-YIG nuclease family protein [Planctomycetota bacterium]